MSFRIAFFGAVAAVFSFSCSAAPVTELVSERASLDLGEKMPGLGEFEIILSETVPSDAAGIQEFWIDHESGQFIANLISGDGLVRRISGYALLTLPVPVAKRQLMPDDIIKESDLEILRLPWQRVQSFAVLNEDDLIGKQVKHLIVEGRPIQERSIIPPLVISRGDLVKIELTYGPMRLAANGKSIGDAYKGQEVRVVNLSSNKIISGIARSDGTVEVK